MSMSRNQLQKFLSPDSRMLRETCIYSQTAYCRTTVIPIREERNFMFDAYARMLMQASQLSGRAGREEFWLATASHFVVLIILYAMNSIFTAWDQNSIAATAFAIVLAIYFIGGSFSHLSLTVRRLHDTNRSGWWYYISIIPAVGLLILLIICCEHGTQGRNRFGDI